MAPTKKTIGFTIGFIGAGRIAEAIIKGLIDSGLLSPAKIVANDRDVERATHIDTTYRVKVLTKKFEVVNASDVIVIAVKPGDVDEVLEDIGPVANADKLIISVVAGITTDAIRDALRAGAAAGAGASRAGPPRIIRAMPNTPALLGCGATGIYAGGAATEDDYTLAASILGAVGITVRVEDETLLDVITGLSGSGPAYFFLIMEALIEAGVEAGLNKTDAHDLVTQTALGAATLARVGDRDLGELIDMVSSPGGTTVAGLKALSDRSLKETLKEAVKAATKRSRELSEKP